jgi:hypothetical protein
MWGCKLGRRANMQGKQVNMRVKSENTWAKKATPWARWENISVMMVTYGRVK